MKKYSPAYENLCHDYSCHYVQTGEVPVLIRKHKTYEIKIFLSKTDR